MERAMATDLELARTKWLFSAQKYFLGLRIRVNLPLGLLVSVAREGNVEELWNGDGWRHVSRNFFRSFYLAEKGLWSGAGLCLKRWASLSSYIQQHYVEQERW